MRSEAIRYSVSTTLLSVVNGIRIATLHMRLPEYRLQIVDLTQCIIILSCSVVSLGLTCSNSSDNSVAVLRGIVSVLIPVPWVMRNNVVLLGQS